ncbi:MAG: LysR substrate-binding domain-containing protein [Pseudomonadota bacterium]
MKITFRQIDAFRTVVSTGTVTESAQILGISQPAVSRLISDLEAEVGFKLFTRAGRNLKPSLEARLLVDEVRTALSGLERIKQAADSIRKFKHARLRLVTTPTFSTLLTPRLIKTFAERRPEAMVSLEIQPNDDTVDWMVSQNHDFGIAPPTGKNPSLENLALINTDAVCIVPVGHRLSSLEKVLPEDLADENFISYQPDAQFRFEVDDVFRAAGVERGMQYEARTTDAICCLVAEGLGVSIVGSVEGAHGALSGCKALPFEPTIPFRAALKWSTQKTLSAVAEDFLEMVREEFSPG